MVIGRHDPAPAPVTHTTHQLLRRLWRRLEGRWAPIDQLTTTEELATLIRAGLVRRYRDAYSFTPRARDWVAGR